MTKQKNIRALISKEGKISTPDLMEFKEALIHFPEQEVDIIVRKRQRTTQQNRALHWGLNIFAEGLSDLGYKISMLDLKYELQSKGFYGWREYETKDGMKRRPKGTSEMKVDECAEAFNNLQMAAAHYEIFIPDPDKEKL